MKHIVETRAALQARAEKRKKLHNDSGSVYKLPVRNLVQIEKERSELSAIIAKEEASVCAFIAARIADPTVIRIYLTDFAGELGKFFKTRRDFEVVDTLRDWVRVHFGSSMRVEGNQNSGFALELT